MYDPLNVLRKITLYENLSAEATTALFLRKTVSVVPV